MPKAPKSLYKIIFHNQGKIYEIFARSVAHGDLFGFIEVSDLVFGQKSAVIVDPNENSLREEFADSEKVFIPLHSVIRVEMLNAKSETKPRVLQMAKEQETSGARPEERLASIYTPPNPFGNR